MYPGWGGSVRCSAYLTRVYSCEGRCAGRACLPQKAVGPSGTGRPDLANEAAPLWLAITSSPCQASRIGPQGGVAGGPHTGIGLHFEMTQASGRGSLRVLLPGDEKILTAQTIPSYRREDHSGAL